MGSFTTHCQTPVLTAIDGERCGSGTVDLSVSSDIASTINWYASTATGGSSLGTGVNYTTPSISSTTSYWVQAYTLGASQNQSILQTATPSSTDTTSSTDAGIVFTTTTANIPIKGAKIFVSGSGNMTFKLQTSAGVDIASTVIAVSGATTSGFYDISFPATFVTGATGGGYRLLCTAKDAGITWYYQTGTYPFSTSLNEVSVTSGWGWGASSSTEVRCIFGIAVEATEICSSSPRTEVAATITPAPALTLVSASETICNYTSTGTMSLTAGSGDYDTFVWSPATNVSGDHTSGWTFNPSATTTYTLTASQTGGSECNNTATFTVTVNPAPTPVDIAQTSEAICGGVVKTLTVTGGVFSANGTVGTGIINPSTTSYPNPF